LPGSSAHQGGALGAAQKDAGPERAAEGAELVAVLNGAGACTISAIIRTAHAAGAPEHLPVARVPTSIARSRI
jgi:hypothetical protein